MSDNYVDGGDYGNNVVPETGTPTPAGNPPVDPPAPPPPDPVIDGYEYTLNITASALAWTVGSYINPSLILAFLKEKGANGTTTGLDTWSVAIVTDSFNVPTGVIQVRAADNTQVVTPAVWATYAGDASVTNYGTVATGDTTTTTQAGAATSYGYSTTASGASSTAYGRNAKATGGQSVAVGDSAIASGDRAVAAGQGAEASGDFSFAAGQKATAQGASSVASGALSLAQGNSSVATGTSASARADSATATGAVASVPSTSPRSSAYGAGATVPASTPDVGIWRNNSLELVPSRTGGTNDPTALKLHASDGTVHPIGVNTGTGVLTVDSTVIASGASVTAEATARANADALLAPLASPVFTGAPTIPSTGWTNAQHDHSTTAKGGAIPEASVTNLVTDLAAKASTTALTTETTNRTNADLLLLPKKAIPSGQYYTNLNYGCYGSITTLALAANTGYFIPIDMMYGSGSFTNISLNITATGTATTIKWAVYARSGSGNATGNVLASGTMSATATGLAVGTISPSLVMPTDGVPVEYNLCFVADGTVTVTAVSGVRNMYRSGNMLLTVTSGRTSAVTFATGFVNSPTYTYTDQTIVPLAGLKAA